MFLHLLQSAYRNLRTLQMKPTGNVHIIWEGTQVSKQTIQSWRPQYKNHLCLEQPGFDQVRQEGKKNTSHLGTS